MITDRLMSIGEWSLSLLPETPVATRRAFGWGINVFVTPTRFDRAVSYANLKTSSVYAGLVFRQADQLRKFGGPGLLGYLQTGKGDGFGLISTSAAPTFGPVTFATALSNMAGNPGLLNGLTPGSAHSATATTCSVVAGSYGPPTKSTIDQLAATTGNEYRVLPNGTIDYGVSTSLFRSTPTVAVAPGLKGADAALRVLENTQWMVSRNIDNYRNIGSPTSQDGTYGPVRFYATNYGSLFPAYGGAGAGAAYAGPKQALQTNVHAEVDAAAQPYADQYSTPVMDIKCSVREYCIPRFVTPGDWIWIYSVEDDLTDTSNQVVFQGQTLFPQKVRCVGYTYPIEMGMGVYTYNAFTSTVTDVSDYVQWETGDTSLELVSKPQSILDIGDRSVLL